MSGRLAVTEAWKAILNQHIRIERTPLNDRHSEPDIDTLAIVHSSDGTAARSPQAPNAVASSHFQKRFCLHQQWRRSLASLLAINAAINHVRPLFSSNVTEVDVSQVLFVNVSDRLFQKITEVHIAIWKNSHGPQTNIAIPLVPTQFEMFVAV